MSRIKDCVPCGICPLLSFLLLANLVRQWRMYCVGVLGVFCVVFWGLIAL